MSTHKRLVLGLLVITFAAAGIASAQRRDFLRDQERAFQTHNVTDEFVTSKQVIAVKVLYVDREYLSQLKEWGISPITSATVVAANKIDLDGETIRYLSERRFDDVDLRDLMGSDPGWLRQDEEARRAVDNLLSQLTLE